MQHRLQAQPLRPTLNPSGGKIIPRQHSRCLPSLLISPHTCPHHRSIGDRLTGRSIDQDDICTCHAHHFTQHLKRSLGMMQSHAANYCIEALVIKRQGLTIHMHYFTRQSSLVLHDVRTHYVGINRLHQLCNIPQTVADLENLAFLYVRLVVKKPMPIIS